MKGLVQFSAKLFQMVKIRYNRRKREKKKRKNMRKN